MTSLFKTIKSKKKHLSRQYYFYHVFHFDYDYVKIVVIQLKHLYWYDML